MVINVRTDAPYNVYIENGILERTGEIVASMYKPATRIMLFSDSNVFPIYGEKVMGLLSEKGFTVHRHVIPAGEEFKTMSTVMGMYKALAEGGFTRTDLIITLGGGVTGDMGGFAAATFLRGMDFIQIPTSLLAQVDASVGGKTAIDLPYGKNLVGAFHQPKAVITDPQVLRTLPKYFFIDGMGEVVKHACIWDKELFADLESGKALQNLEETICKNILCKRHMVEEDTKEKGLRMILNFGHTFGHALEKLHDFKDLSHGRAVAIGMLMAANIGESLGMTEKGTAERLENLLEALELPTSDIYPIDKIIDATALDKKSKGKNLNIILLKNIGECFIHTTDRNYLILRCKILEEQRLRNGKG